MIHGGKIYNVIASIAYITCHVCCCRYSYDLAEQYFTSAHNYLAPDSAFAVGSIRMNIVPVYDIIWLKRDDWESQNDEMPQFPAGVTVQVTDWSDKWMEQTSENFWEDHQLRTMTGISFLARAKARYVY